MTDQNVLNRVTVPDLVPDSPVTPQDEPPAVASPAWTYDTWFSGWYRRSGDAPVELSTSER